MPTIFGWKLQLNESAYSQNVNLLYEVRHVVKALNPVYEVTAKLELWVSGHDYFEYFPICLEITNTSSGLYRKKHIGPYTET